MGGRVRGCMARLERLNREGNPLPQRRAGGGGGVRNGGGDGGGGEGGHYDILSGATR